VRSVRIPAPVSVPVLLVVTTAAAGFATLDTRVARRPPPEPVTRPQPDGGAVGHPSGEAVPAGESWLGEVVLAAVLLLGLGLAGWLLWLLLRRYRRASGGRGRRYRLRALRPAAGPATPVDEERLRAAVDEAVARSEDDGDPRRAVIACWVRLAEAAGEAGIDRYRSDTATDLVVRLLRRQRVGEPALAAFVEAYWLARYTTHPVDEQMRAQARSSLRRLRAELVAEVPS
jgi:hypothetical protein